MLGMVWYGYVEGNYYRGFVGIMSHPTELDVLFNRTRKIISHYRHTGSGRFVMDFKRSPQTGKEIEFDILLYGWARPFRISSSQVKDYLAKQERQSSNIFHPNPFIAIEESVLRVLQEGGYGSIWLEFKPEKGNVVLLMEQRFSKRYLFRN
jgi:hypothetical protein